MSSYDMPLSESDYQKQEKKMADRFAKAADKSDSKVLKEIAKEDKYDADPARQMQCRMARQVFEESLDMYEEGDMTFDEMIDDLTKALKAI